MNSVYHFQTVKHIVHGAQSLEQLPEKLALLDRPIRRIAFITQPAMERNGVAAGVVSALESKDIQVLTVRDVQRSPRSKTSRRCSARRSSPSRRTPSCRSAAAACSTQRSSSRCA